MLHVPQHERGNLSLLDCILSYVEGLTKDVCSLNYTGFHAYMFMSSC